MRKLVPFTLIKFLIVLSTNKIFNPIHLEGKTVPEIVCLGFIVPLENFSLIWSPEIENTIDNHLIHKHHLNQCQNNWIKNWLTEQSNWKTLSPPNNMHSFILSNLEQITGYWQKIMTESRVLQMKAEVRG